MIIDAKNAVLGRMSSFIAKQLLKGEQVTVINPGKAIITGNPKKTKTEHAKKRKMGTPHHGPFITNSPKGMIRRTVRGMLPMNTKKGREAFKRLSVRKAKEGEKGEQVGVKEIKTSFVTLEKLTK